MQAPAMNGYHEDTCNRVHRARPPGDRSTTPLHSFSPGRIQMYKVGKHELSGKLTLEGCLGFRWLGVDRRARYGAGWFITGHVLRLRD